MSKIKRDTIKVSEIIQLIPDHLFAGLSEHTKVDYQVKKLYGRNVFYLLLYGLLKSERLGLRSLEDFYNSSSFKILFDIPEDNQTKYNSLSSRLATMNVEFFKKAYELIYEQFSELYDDLESHKYKITRVDSTMVCDTATKLEKGISVGSKKNGKKQLKYTVCLTNLLPSSVELFNEQSHISENLTIPKAILKVIDKRQDNVFAFDRGVSSRDIFCKLDDSDCAFVTRLKIDARYVPLMPFNTTKGLKVGNLSVISDQMVNLYKSGDNVIEHPFRLLITENEQGKRFLFLSNKLDIKAKDIIYIYKKRWDIEVFFRFIKQELNFTHFISVSENGIKIILYMTLILAMLILIYKKINKVGYKTAKRRFNIELGDLLTALIVEYCGGDPKLVFR
jgi:hypothetical protein